MSACTTTVLLVRTPHGPVSKLRHEADRAFSVFTGDLPAHRFAMIILSFIDYVTSRPRCRQSLQISHSLLVANSQESQIQIWHDTCNTTSTCFRFCSCGPVTFTVRQVPCVEASHSLINTNHDHFGLWISTSYSDIRPLSPAACPPLPHVCHYNPGHRKLRGTDSLVYSDLPPLLWVRKVRRSPPCPLIGLRFHNFLLILLPEPRIRRDGPH